MLPLDGDPELFVTTSEYNGAPRFSPDGRFLAYASDDSGRNEVHVVPYPDADDRCVISTHGGAEPVWSRDGRELFFRREDEMVAVDIDATAGRFSALPEPHGSSSAAIISARLRRGHSSTMSPQTAGSS